MNEYVNTLSVEKRMGWVTRLLKYLIEITAARVDVSNGGVWNSGIDIVKVI